MTNSPGPALVFAATTFDFGKVPSGKVLAHDFVFTNTGSRLLELEDVKSSCGCTVATNWTRRLEPGKSGVIPVLFDTSGMAGPVRKTLWVTCNDPAQRAVLLDFTATISKFIDAVPGIAVFTFGPDFQTNESRVIRLINNLDEPVALSAPVCASRAFKAELKTVRDGKEFELRVFVVPPLGAGSFSDLITLKTSSQKMPVVTVKAYAVVQPSVTLTPPRIVLPPAALAQPLRVEVTLKNNGTNFMVLGEPSVNTTGAKAQLRVVQPGRVFSLTVVFAAGFQLPSDREIEVSLKSSHPTTPLLKVPIASAAGSRLGILLDQNDTAPLSAKAAGLPPEK